MAGHVSGCVISNKIRRSIKAGALVLALGLAAAVVARPFVSVVDTDLPLDPIPPAYADFESEHPVWPEIGEADSELSDRASRPVERVMAVGSGDTVADVMERAGVAPADAGQAMSALLSVYDPRSLKAGQKVTVTFAPPPDGLGRGPFQAVSLNPDPMREVKARRTAERGFAASEAKRQVTREIAHYSGSIKSSLFESAHAAGVPTPVIITMIHALSYDVDFQRDIQAGDSFDVMFEGYYDPKGHLVRAGDMLYAAVGLAGRPIAMFRFENNQGVVEYFNAKGESVKKALLRTPVDGAKITSGFGMRRHPILGYTKMHKGVDFGVPAGTPIMAAGDGIVEVAGFHGSYGNYVRLRHSNGYGTAYAHMSRIAPGIHPGKHVAQGQVIGFVGATGRATGPHLHFEVLVNHVQVNPMSVKMPTGTKLAGRELERFKRAKARLEDLLVRIPSATRIAASPAKSGGALTD